MTGQQVYEIALSLVPELKSDVPDLNTYVVGWLNLCIAESVNAENSLLAFEGKEPLAEIPSVASVADQVPLHDVIVRTALPYGIAEYAFRDDDNESTAVSMRMRFVAALNDLSKVIPSEISDCCNIKGF